MRVVARELVRCARAWEDVADEVEVSAGVLAELDAAALGEAEVAAREFVAAVVWWVEQVVASARALAAALWAWAQDLTGTEQYVAARFTGVAGGASW